MTLKRKDKACRVCKKIFTPQYNATGQIVCSWECAIEQSRQKQQKAAEKAQKKRDAKERDNLKPRSRRIAEAQVAFCRYIRARDYGKPCISCGSWSGDIKFGGATDCGHYRSTGAAPHLRYCTWNAAGQCVKCNRYLSGNVVEMRKGMIERFGLDRVEWVENNNDVRKFDIDYLKRVKTIFTKKARMVEKRKGFVR